MAASGQTYLHPRIQQRPLTNEGVNQIYVDQIRANRTASEINFNVRSCWSPTCWSGLWVLADATTSSDPEDPGFDTRGFSAPRTPFSRGGFWRPAASSDVLRILYTAHSVHHQHDDQHTAAAESMEAGAEVAKAGKGLWIIKWR
jgi:hypothetical protein